MPLTSTLFKGQLYTHIYIHMYTYMYIHVSTWPEAPLLLFSRSVVSDSFATPWTVDHQAPLSMGFSRKEYWSGLPFPSPGDLSDPGIEPHLLQHQACSLPLSRLGSP